MSETRLLPVNILGLAVLLLSGQAVSVSVSSGDGLTLNFASSPPSVSSASIGSNNLGGLANGGFFLLDSNNMGSGQTSLLTNGDFETVSSVRLCLAFVCCVYVCACVLFVDAVCRAMRIWPLVSQRSAATATRASPRRAPATRTARV